MTLHRRNQRYSPAYLRRKLTSLASQIEAVRSAKIDPGDWRRACDKRRLLDKLEAEQMRFERIANPPPVERFYTLPF